MKAWSAIIVLVAIASILTLTLLLLPNSPPKRQETSYGEALIGGAFEAVDHKGNTITDADLHGKYTLVYFGFTHCPDICPTGLLKIANAMDALGIDAEQVTPVFVSVDPERDTPEILAQYVAHFHPSLIGITGTVEQVKQLADAYKVYFQKAPDEGSALGYLVDHSSFTYFMGPDGKYITHFGFDASEADIQLRVAATLGER